MRSRARARGARGGEGCGASGLRPETVAVLCFGEGWTLRAVIDRGCAHRAFPPRRAVPASSVSDPGGAPARENRTRRAGGSKFAPRTPWFVPKAVPLTASPPPLRALVPERPPHRREQGQYARGREGAGSRRVKSRGGPRIPAGRIVGKQRLRSRNACPTPRPARRARPPAARQGTGRDHDEVPSEREQALDSHVLYVTKRL